MASLGNMLYITLRNIKNADQGAVKRKNLLATYSYNIYVIKDNRKSHLIDI